MQLGSKSLDSPDRSIDNYQGRTDNSRLGRPPKVEKPMPGTFTRTDIHLSILGNKTGVLGSEHLGTHDLKF